MKRSVAVILGSLAFGVIAGTTMVGMNVAAERIGLVKQQIYAEYETPGDVTQAVEETTQALTEAASTQAASAGEGKSVADIAEEAMPSVVAITNMVKYQQNGYSMWGYPTQSQEYEVPASGSGIIIGKTDDELLIVTNNHVVEDSSSLSVTFVDNEAVDASIKGTDSTVDLAVIAVQLEDIPTDTLNQIKVATLGDSDEVKVGEQVVAIGNALGYGQSVTTGIISAKDRTLQTEDGESTGLLQTDAAINPGNSGGALLNMKGEVIGINVAKYASTSIEGMGYAIPSSKAETVIENLSTLKTRVEIPESERGYLGVQVKNIDEQTAANFDMPQGVFIYKLTEGGAAAQSELQEKDIITALDGQGLKSYDELQELLSYYRAGETVNLTVQRPNGDTYEELTVSVTLGTNPEAQTSETQQSDSQSQQDGQNGQNGQNSDVWQQFEEFFRQYQNR